MPVKPSYSRRPFSRGREGFATHPFGFTLIEVLAVLAIIATLLTLALPRYFVSLERSKEAVLRQDLAVLRDAIDKYYGDNGKYPETLVELADRKYIRAVPVDPLTESAETWVAIPPEDLTSSGVYDVRSGASGSGADGTLYADW